MKCTYCKEEGLTSNLSFSTMGVFHFKKWWQFLSSNRTIGPRAPTSLRLLYFFCCTSFHNEYCWGSCRPSGAKAAAFLKCLDFVALLLLSGNRNCWVKMGCFFSLATETFSWNKHCMTFIGLTRPAHFFCCLLARVPSKCMPRSSQCQ